MSIINVVKSPAAMICIDFTKTPDIKRLKGSAGQKLAAIRYGKQKQVWIHFSICLLKNVPEIPMYNFYFNSNRLKAYFLITKTTDRGI